MKASNVALGKVAKFIRGVTYKPADLVDNFSEDSIVCMRTANIQQELDESDLKSIRSSVVKSEEKYLQEGDILVSTANSWNLVGKCCWVSNLNYLAVPGGFIAVLRVDDHLADARYVYHWFNSKKTQELARNCGRQTTNISNMDLNRCLLLELPLPPLPEQRRIAAILDKAEALRAKRREAITKLDLLLESTFIHFFGDPIKNPNKFHFLPLSKIISRDTINGAYYPKDKYVDNNGTPMVHMSDAFYDTVSTKGLKMVNIPKSEVDKYSIDDSDILIARRSLVYEGAAKPCRPKPEGKEMIFESSFIRVTPDKSIIDTAYLFNYLKNKCVRKNFILKFVTKSTISGINQKNLNMIEVMIPDIESQNKFRLMEEKINEKKILLKKQEFVFDNFIKSLNKSFFK